MVPSTREVPRTRERLPVRAGGRLTCPRCSTRLLREHDMFVCVACGYECAVRVAEAAAATLEHDGTLARP